jgi:hypothetical protein
MPHPTGGLTRHHRKPRSIGGKSEPRNVVQIPGNKHAAWHLLFRNFPAQEIARLITEMYLDPDYEFIAVRKEELCASSPLLSGSSSRSR